MLTPILRKRNVKTAEASNRRNAQQRRPPVSVFTSVPSRPPSRLSRLRSGNVDIIDIWQSDLNQPERPTSTQAERGGTIDETSKYVKDLSLKERLFLFYSRFAQNMKSSVEEIATQWEINEEMLEQVLMKKYRTNLDQSGLGKTGEAIVNVERLRREMKAFGIQVAVSTKGHSDVESRASSASRIVTRDRMLLSQHGARRHDEEKRYHDAFSDASGSTHHRQHLESLRPKTSGMIRMQLNLKEDIFAVKSAENSSQSTTRGSTAVSSATFYSRNQTPLVAMAPSVSRASSSVMRPFTAPAQRESEPPLAESDYMQIESPREDHPPELQLAEEAPSEVITERYECLIVEEEPASRGLVDLQPGDEVPTASAIERRPSTNAGRRAGGGRFFRRRSSAHSQESDDVNQHSRVHALLKGFQQRRLNRKTRQETEMQESVEGATAIQRWWRSKMNKADNLNISSQRGKGSLMQMQYARKLGMRWLSRIRRKIDLNQQHAACIIIQRHFRGMRHLKKLRQNQRERLLTAAKSIQDAWRKHSAWKAFVRDEMTKAQKQAKILQKEYLFGGKSREELKKLRESAASDFESNTSELGRNKVNAMQDADKGIAKAAPTPFEVWMETLHALLKQEKEEESPPVARKRMGMNAVLQFSNPSNPDDVSRELSKQRGGGGRALHLTKMNLKRWPYGITDKLLGRPIWYELTSVFLSENKLAGLPEDFYKLTNLMELRLNNNQIKTISPSVGYLRNLNSIWLHSNLLTTLPSQISHLTDLSFLSLNDNKISFLPFQLASLSKLSKLPLHNNLPLKTPPPHLAKESYTHDGCSKVLDFLQRFVASMEQPFELDLESFDMTAVPELNLATKCQVISLSRNSIEQIPQEVFFDMKFVVPWHPHLQSLDLSHNRFEVISDFLFRLTSLKTLNLSNNRLKDIPVDILSLSKLEVLKVEGNPLVSPPPSVVSRGLDGCFVEGDLQDDALKGFYRLTRNDKWEQKYVKTCKKQRDRVLIKTSREATSQWLLHSDGAESPWELRSSGLSSHPAKQDGMWFERDAGRVCVNQSVRLRFLGILEYCRRILLVREQRNEILRLRGKITKEKKKMSMQDLRVTKQMYKEKMLSVCLDLSYLELHTLPPQIEDKLIRKLILDNNLIKRLPGFIFHLPLSHLSFNHNLIKEIPNEVSKLQDLEILSCIGNEIKTLPSCLRQNVKLSSVFAGGNRINMVAAVLADLEHLEYLDFSHNPISSSTPQKDSLSSLRVLDLSYCGFDNSLQVIPQLTGLLSLNMSNNQLTQIPPSVFHIKSLQVLVIAKNIIQSDDLSFELLFKHCRELQALDVSGNSMTSFPPMLTMSHSLLSIDLSLNHLAAFPAALRSMANLKVLNLARNYIQSIPSECGFLSSLQELLLAGNQLRHLAAELRQCTSLEVLDLSDNKLKKLPPQPLMAQVVLGNLERLRVLDVSGNALEFVPQDITLCSQLQSLRCHGNPSLSSELHKAQEGFFGQLQVTVKRVSFPPPRPSKINFVHMEISLEGSAATARYSFQTASRACTAVAQFDETFQFMIQDLTACLLLRLKSDKDSNESFDHSTKFPVKLLLLSQAQVLQQFDSRALATMSESCDLVRGDEGEVFMTAEREACSLIMLLRGSLTERTSTGVRRFHAGAMLGLESLAQGSSLEHNLQLSSNAILLLLPSASLSTLMRSNPARLPYVLIQNEVLFASGGLEQFCEQLPQKLLTQQGRKEYQEKVLTAALNHKFSTHEQETAIKSLQELLSRLETAFPNFHSIAMESFDSKAQSEFQLSPSSLDLSKSVIEHADTLKKPQVSVALGVKEVSVLEGFKYLINHSQARASPQSRSADEQQNQVSDEMVMSEEEIDWKREEEEMKVVKRALEETKSFLLSTRYHRMWESMQLMYFVQGNMDRPWDYAHDTRSDLAVGHFYGMKHVLEAMISLQDPSDMLTSNPGRNFHLLQQIQASLDAKYRRKSIAEEGSQDRQVKETPEVAAVVKRRAVDSWEWLCGRIMMHPKFIALSRAQIAAQPFQDWQIMAVKAMQENGEIEYKIQQASAELDRLGAERERAEAEQKKNFDRLSSGWNREAAAKLKAANQQVSSISKRSELLRSNRTRLKAFLHLKKMEDSKRFSLSSTRAQDVFDAVVEQAEAGSIVFRDASSSINEELSASAGSLLLDGWSSEDLQHWLEASESLATRSREEQEELIKRLSSFNIRPRMFVHLTKEDLLRMRFRSADAWIMLLAVQELRQHLRLPAHADFNRRLALKLAEMKLNSSVLTLLGKDFNIREQDMAMLLDAFKRFDRQDVDEVQTCDLRDVCAECHLPMSDEQFERLVSKLGLNKSESFDFISFCQTFQEARAMVTHEGKLT